ncbi:MAG: deoxyuridine 5'-triphosphate nucleotidohydrolase [Clostridia bacterium]|nr:deoxyuridine 5'-triphosphate nucleotidohydrolase [Clostridia bacterium]
MEKIARFEKISEDQFALDAGPMVGKDTYADIKMPRRATKGSAGYDFYAPYDIELAPGEEMTVHTGIRARISEGWVLVLCPRSGLGFRYRMQLNNTLGIIDSDYYNAKNEGHIMARIFNDSRQGKTLSIKKGEGFMQGIFLPFGITEDDEASGERLGGFGSTTR